MAIYVGCGGGATLVALGFFCLLEAMYLQAKYVCLVLSRLENGAPVCADVG